MKLEPDTFRCEQHDNQAYLTAAVRGQFVRQSLVSYARKPDPRPFKVIATCPGKDGENQHTLVFEGMWTE